MRTEVRKESRPCPNKGCFEGLILKKKSLQEDACLRKECSNKDDSWTGSQV